MKTESASRRSCYRPEIDGLRAIAVSAVVLFHFGFPLPGGFVGVDVFFVISGFLITGIVHRELSASVFSLSEFWARRVRRIFPAMFLMVVVSLCVGCLLLLPNELAELGEASLAQAFLLANVYFWRDTGYFAAPSELKPLLHTWSLAVEEQFYLVLPPLLVLCRSQSRHRLFVLLGVIAALSFMGSVYGTAFHASATFFLLPTRAWELLVGCMLAVLPWEIRSDPFRDCLIGLAGLLGIVLPVLLYDSATRFPGLAAVPPVFGSAAVILSSSNTRDTFVVRLLSSRSLVFVGLISYSLYLWHWPVLAFARAYCGHLDFKQSASLFIVSVAVSVLSWRWIETPLRRNFFVGQGRRLSCAVLLMTGVVAAAGIALVKTGGLPSRYPGFSSALFADTTWTGEEYATSLRAGFEFETLPGLGSELEGRQGEERIDFVIWGDSHGRMICSLVDEIALRLDLSGKAIVTSNVPPVPNTCMPFNQGRPARAVLERQRNVMEMLASRRPRHLVLVSRWSWYTDGDSQIEAESSSRSHLLSDDAGKLTVSEKPETVLGRNLEELAAFCQRNEICLWLMKQVPETGELFPARDLFLYAIGRTERLANARFSREHHQGRQAKAEAVFQRQGLRSVRFLDPADLLLDREGRTINYLKGRSVYRDNDHLTKWGLELLRPLVTEVMVEIGRDSELSPAR